MDPGQTALDRPEPDTSTAEASRRLSASAGAPLNPVRTGQGPQNEEKRTLEGESRTNVPRTDRSGPDALRGLKPQPSLSAPLSAETAANIRAEAPMGPQNEEKRILEGESRTNVPRADGSGLDPEGRAEERRRQAMDCPPLSSPTRSGLRVQAPKGRSGDRPNGGGPSGRDFPPGGRSRLARP